MNPTSRNTRRWTDDELRRAVASSRTWKDVAIALGLSVGNGTRVKRYAHRLGLDISHFTETRRWSERDLRDAVERHHSWPDVIRQLGIDNDSDAIVRIKGHCVRLGIDVSKFDTPQRASAAAGLLTFEPNMSQLRNVAESIAVVWFGMRGVSVALPAEVAEYDLLVTLESGIKRVQVKSSTFKGKYGTWVVGVGRRPYALDKTAGREPYDPSVIDYFFIVVGDGGLYLVPSEAVAGMTAISVGAYEAYRVGDASSLVTVAA